MANRQISELPPASSLTGAELLPIYQGGARRLTITELAQVAPEGPAGPTGPAGDDGDDGEQGLGLLSGSGPPSSGLGRDGEFYLDTAATRLYGPKTAGAWGPGVSLIGPAGTNGTNGTDGDDGAPGTPGAPGEPGADGVGVPSGGTTGQSLVKASDTDYDTEWVTVVGSGGGTPGADGRTVLNGTGAPTNGQGADGDFYINTTTHEIHGPKAGGTWPAGVSLIGPQGNTGSPGADGTDGADGAAGATGATGDPGPPGPGVAAGGTTGQLLAKNSGTDYDTELIDAPAGGSEAYITVATGSGGSDTLALIVTGLTETTLATVDLDATPSAAQLTWTVKLSANEFGQFKEARIRVRRDSITGPVLWTQTTGVFPSDSTSGDATTNSGTYFDTAAPLSGVYLLTAQLIQGTSSTQLYSASRHLDVIGFVGTGEAGPAGADGTDGADGADGRTILSGSGAPGGGLGVDGDYYLDTAVTRLYGPKTAGSWGSGVSLIGSAGSPGADGAPGADGKTVRSGSGAPSSGLGVDGDFYINTAANTIYGPKTAGAWGSPTSLVGPQGTAGTNGSAGPGVAAGGTTGQVLQKNSATDYDTVWATPTTPSPAFTTKTANYTALGTDYAIWVDSSGGAVTIGLPTAVGRVGQSFEVKDWKGQAAINNIIVDPNGSETIDGTATKVLNVPYMCLTVRSDGTNWGIV